MTIIHLVIVGIGGFLGAIARFSISKSLNKTSTAVPIGTLTVNLSGAFLAGIVTGANSDIMITLLFGAGFLGAFTTFSTFKLEIIQIYLNKYKKAFILYVILTYGLGIILAYLGYITGNTFLK